MTKMLIETSENEEVLWGWCDLFALTESDQSVREHLQQLRQPQVSLTNRTPLCHNNTHFINTELDLVPFPIKSP